jgi:RNA polymerase sigma-70 factor (ECF subfamily)
VQAVTNQCSGERSNDPANTLGSVLYADSEPPVAESEWAEIVHGIANRDEAALKELYERTHRIVFTLNVRILKDPLTAEEVLLDVYHDVWRKAATYDPTRGTVIAWLMNQTRSRAIDRLRTNSRKKRTDPHRSPDGDSETPLSSSIVEQQRSVLERGMRALTPQERQAIETAYFQELTYAEVAQRLGEPLGTIKTRIRTGLAKLRALLHAREDL